jgi:hypothetical protein
MTEEEMVCDEALALSLSWEEVSECQKPTLPSSSSSSVSSSLSFVGLEELDENTIGHWDVVSLLCDAIQSLSGHSMDWTYRDALLFSSKATSSITLLGAPTGNTKNVSARLAKTKRGPAPTKIAFTKYLKAEQEHSDEMNEQLLDFDENVKPMSEKQRRKYEASGRRRLLRGHTGRAYPRGGYLTKLSEVSLESKSRADPRPDEEFLTAVEEAFDGKLCKKRSQGSQSWNLNKNQAWDRVPEILQARAQEIETTRAQVEGRSATVYRLPVTTIVKNKLGREEKVALRQEERRARLIFYKPQGRPNVYSDQMEPRSVFAELSMGPPENVQDEPLPWTLRGKIGTNQTRKTAMINGSHGLFVEDGQLLPGTQQRYFEIDLGEITAISTQGGPPPVRMYPSLTSDVTLPGGPDDSRRRFFSYKGPTWSVYDPDMAVCDSRCKELRWIRSYKLYWRADQGRHWNSLGLFRANDDTTTEKALTFASIGAPAIACRFLRIIPVDCEKGGALRVGVYGKAEGYDHAKLTAQTSMASDENMVEYTLYQPSKLHAPNADLRDCGPLRYGRSYRTAQQERRNQRARACQEEIDEHTKH